MNRNNTKFIYAILMIVRGFGIALTAGVYVKYLNIHGMSLLQTQLINCVFYFSLIIFDVPTGAFADVFGRKKSIMMSGLFYIICSTVYAMSTTATGFCIAEALGAIAATFHNGALSSWMVDRLNHQKVVFDKTSLFARMQIIFSLSGIPAAAFGSWLMTKDIRFPWFAEAIVLGSMSILTYFLVKEEYFKRRKVSLKKNYRLMCLSVRSSFLIVRRNKVVRFIVLSSMVQIFAVQALNMQWALRYETMIGGMGNLGRLFSAFLVAGIIGAILAEKMVKRGVNESKLIDSIQVSIGLLIIGAALLPGWWSLALFVIHQIPRGMYQPVKNAYLHDHIPKRVRATMTSFESVFPNVGGVIGLGTTGMAGQYMGIPFAWTVSGISLIIIAIYLARIKV